jgi:hypothetical protein
MIIIHMATKTLVLPRQPRGQMMGKAGVLSIRISSRIQWDHTKSAKWPVPAKAICPEKVRDLSQKTWSLEPFITVSETS